MSLDVSRETADKLGLFGELVRKWNPRINLVSPATLDALEARHVADSVQLVALLAEAPLHWVDLGSGGGFPGIVASIILRDEPTRFTLIESDQRKAAFLRAACRTLDLSHVAILTTRIEEASPQHADVVSARALAPLDRLMPLVRRHLSANGVALLPKGRNWAAEVEAARCDWQFQYRSFPSKTDPEAVILKISGVSHA